MNKNTVVAKTYDLLLTAIPFISRLPKNHKFTYGDRIQNMLADLLELMIEAYYAPAPQKKAILKKTNILLEKLRYFFRLGYELGLFNSTKYKEFAQRIDEIGRMVGGWIKSIKS